MVTASVSTFHDHKATPAALVAARRCFSCHIGIRDFLVDRQARLRRLAGECREFEVQISSRARGQSGVEREIARDAGRALRSKP
jgi:hypothetical protein